ncbi:MAG: LamG domain-containing protein [Candidatus Poribacteria bacterium]|nr:LamG domain-containing protein [Candidatus Poribacteria bacterium]
MDFGAIFSRKFWLAGLVFVCSSLFFVGLFCVSTTSAKIDPATVTGLWLFDEGKGKIATDASGNGLDGDLENSPKWVEGKFGEGLEFDGTGPHVVIPDHENPTEAITVTIWVKSNTDTWNQHGWMVEKRNAYIIHPNQGTKNVSWPICNGGCWNKPGGWRDGEVGPKDITEWHMYTTTYDSNTGEWYIYIDGEEASSMDLTKNPIDPDKGPVYIGNDTCCGGRFADAVVDEVAIFDVALEPEDIQSLYKNGLYFSVLAVEPADKMTTTWADVKVKY